MNYDWNFRVLAPYIGALIRGTGIALWLALLANVAGTVVGVGMGWLFDRTPGARLVLAVNDVIRSIPILVLQFFAFYFPYEQIFGIRPPSAFWCAVIALSIAQAVFTAELVRAVIQTVPQGPILAARALGLSESAIWWNITFPDICRQLLPSMIAFWIGTLKLSSLASVIGVEDLVFVARTAAGQQFRSLEAWITVSAVYAIIITPLTIGAREFERCDWLRRRA